MTIVGTASVVVTADMAGFPAEVEAGADFSGLTDAAGVAGTDAGVAARTGVTDETGKLAGDLTEDGGAAGLALSGGVKDGTEDLAGDLEKVGEDAGGGLNSGLSSKMGGIKSVLSSIGVPSALLGGWGELGLAVVGVAAASIDLGEKMQSADTAIAASSGQTVASATAIGNAMLDTAGKSEFSGEEQAEAYAAVAGQMKATEGATLDTTQAMTLMNAAGDLATAKQISLNTATSTLAATMQAFQMPVKDASDATDILFNASNSTGQGVDTLGAALDKMKSKLGDAAPPLGALASLMVDMTNNGITGRAALTGVNSAMTALVAASSDTTTAGKAANTELQSFGISATTASGQLTPMGTIIDGLAPKYATMTQSQQLATSTLIFGASSAQAMTQVINAGIPALDAATASTTKTGTAQSAATTQSHTLGVEFKTLEATAEDWGTELGQVLIPVLGLLVKGITDVINVVISVISWFGKMSDPALAIAALITAVMIPAMIGWARTAATSMAETADDLLVSAGGWALYTATRIAEYVATAAAATATFVAENAAMLGIGVAIAALIAVGVLLVTHWSEIWGDVKSYAEDAWHFIDSNVLEPIKSAFDAAVNFIKAHWELLAEILLAPVAPALALFLKFHDQIIGFFEDIGSGVAKAWNTLWDGVETAVNDAWNIIKPIFDAIGSAVSDITGALSKIDSAAHTAVNDLNPLHWVGTGGLITQPSIIGVAEAGPELVLNASQTAMVLAGGSLSTNPIKGGSSAVGAPSFGSTAGSSPLVGGDMIINAYGTNMSATDLMSEVGWSLKTNQFTSTPAVA
jgi:TP901 family phage tail tape measure protein